MKARFAVLTALISLGASPLFGARAEALIIGGAPNPNSGMVVFNDFGAVFSGGSDMESQQLYASSAFSGTIYIQSIMFYSTQITGLEHFPTFGNGTYSLSLSTTSVSVNSLAAIFHLT